MPRLFVDSSYKVDIGLKRELNEDVAFSTPDIKTPGDKIISFLCVADGMGGHDAGDVASKTTVEYLQHLFANRGYVQYAKSAGLDQDDFASIIRESLFELNRKILKRAASFNLTKSMGSTCVVGLIVYENLQDKTFLYFGSIGDSRCYVIRRNDILLLTQDDSKVWQLYKAGEISYSDIRTHPKRNIILQALGTSETIKPQVNKFELFPNDKVLLSTDGLHGLLSDTELKRLLKESPRSEIACSKLVAAAIAAGGQDNIGLSVAFCLADGNQYNAPISRTSKKINKLALFSLPLLLTIIVLILFLFPGSPPQPLPPPPPPRDSVKHIEWGLEILDAKPVSGKSSGLITFTIQPIDRLNDQNLGVEIQLDEYRDNTVTHTLSDLKSGNNFVYEAKYKNPGYKNIKIRLKEANKTLAEADTSLYIQQVTPKNNDEDIHKIETENIVQSCKPASKNHIGIVIILADKFKDIKTITFKENKYSEDSQTIKRAVDRFIIPKIKYKSGKQIYITIKNELYSFKLPK